MAMQSSSMAVPSAPQSKPVDTDPATGTPVKPNSHTLGYEFVRQYYTMLNKAPGSVHRFYAEDSSFIHGSLTDSIQSEPVYGQLKINERISALNFKDCHAKIVQVDSLGTVGDGFVIQVTGELSNDGQPMRRFFQTFVLVPRGPNNYYVRNDIFRYQDELFADEEEVSEAEEAEVIRSSASVATSNTIVEPIALVPSSNPSAAASESSVGPSLISADTLSKVSREESQGTTEKTAAAVATPVDKSPKGSLKVNGYQEQKSSANSQGSLEQKQQQQQSQSVGPSHQKSNKSSPQVASGNNPSVTPVTSNLTIAPPSSSSVVQSEKAPVSWAAKVARDTPKPSSSDASSNASATNSLLPSPKASKEQSHLVHNPSPAGQQQQAHHPPHPHPLQQQQSHPHNQAQQASNAQQSNAHQSPQQQQHQQQPQQQSHPPQSGRKGGNRDSKAPKVEKDESNTVNEGDSPGNENNHEVIKKLSPYNDEQQVFVGNLPLDIKEEDLKNFFSKFGNILDVRINRTNQTSGSGRTPNYGFVTFDDAKVVRNILSQKPIYFNEHRFNVEEKRSQGRGSALNRSASGVTLGVNKGANQQHNQQQNSHQARRERRDRFPFQGNRETGPRRNQAAAGSSGAPVMAGQTRPVFQPKR